MKDYAVDSDCPGNARNVILVSLLLLSFLFSPIFLACCHLIGILLTREGNETDSDDKVNAQLHASVNLWPFIQFCPYCNPSSLFPPIYILSHLDIVSAHSTFKSYLEITIQNPSCDVSPIFFGRNWSTSKNNSIKKSQWIHPSELPVNGSWVIYLLEATAIDCFSHTNTYTQTRNKIRKRRMKGEKKKR